MRFWSRIRCYFNSVPLILQYNGNNPRILSKLTDGVKVQTTLKQIVESCNSLYRPYFPTPYLFNGHLSTIFCTLFGFGYQKAYDIKYTRRQIKLLDGGIISLDINFPPVVDSTVLSTDPDATPIVVILHGLSGGSGESYVIDVVHAVRTKLGYRSIVVNFRGCASTPIVSNGGNAKLYHGGCNYDLETALSFIHHLYPQAPLYSVGLSLGANVLAKHLGENPNTLIKAGIVLGTPFNFYAGNLFLHSTIIQRGYSYAMGSNLRKLFTSHLYAFENDERLDLAAIFRTKFITLYEFDELVTAKLGGFKSAYAYYDAVSSDQVLHNVSVPLLALNTIDDPIVDYKTVPAALSEINPNLVFAATKSGGHLGWFQGWYPKRWIGAPIVEFIRGVHEADPEPRIARAVVKAGNFIVASENPGEGFQEIEVMEMDSATTLIKGL